MVSVVPTTNIAAILALDPQISIQLLETVPAEVLEGKSKLLPADFFDSEEDLLLLLRPEGGEPEMFVGSILLLGDVEVPSDDLLAENGPHLVEGDAHGDTSDEDAERAVALLEVLVGLVASENLSVELSAAEGVSLLDEGSQLFLGEAWGVDHLVLGEESSGGVEDAEMAARVFLTPPASVLRDLEHSLGDVVEQILVLEVVRDEGDEESGGFLGGVEGGG